MSTVKATNLQHASSTSVNAVTTSGGDLTNAAGVSFMGGSKNLLYNGAMQVAQRGTSAAAVSATYNTADRWAIALDGLGVWTQSVENDAPTGSGLRKSLKMLCTTADAAPAAGDLILVSQSLEGQDLQRIAKGTASAQQLTISFWVKSNATGTYIVRLIDADNLRNVSASYSVSASATWEKKTITFPADATGAFDNDNAASLRVQFWLGAGSNFTGGSLQTTWAAESATGLATGQTNLAAATNNYWQITGVQLEVGPVATSFEFKSYGQELRECQRYYYRAVTGSTSGRIAYGHANLTTQTNVTFWYPVTMRAPATALDAGGSLAVSDNVAATTVISVSLGSGTQSRTCGIAVANVASGLTIYRPYWLEATSSDTNAYVGFSAEL